MKKLLYTLLAVLLTYAADTTAQSCGMRYKQRVFSSIQIYRDVVYSKAAPKLIAAGLGIETTIDKDLKMDIFMPPPTDTTKNRPVVILAHGGGFVDIAFMGGTILVGTKENEDVQALADTLAHWGYVAACIEYRTGFDVLSRTSVMRAVWRGSQDISAGIRFFRKNATWFGADPSRVFVGGSSAGAFACLHSTFIDNSERIPESYYQGWFMGDLGKMHSRPVVKLTSFHPFAGSNVAGNDVDSLPKAIASYWGAIGDTNWLAGNNKAPVIMFHGTDDATVDAECGKPFSGVLFTAPVTCGSIKMDPAMTNRNILHETHIEQGEGHEYWGVTNGDWILFAQPNQYWKPMIQQTADFFYARMQPAMPQVAGSGNPAVGTTQTYYVVSPQANMQYCWEVVGGTIVSNTGSSIQVYWGAANSSAQVKVRAIDRAGVASVARAYNVGVRTMLRQGATEEEVVLQGLDELVVYPNPSSGVANVAFTAYQTGDIQIYVVDMLGRVAHQQTYTPNAGSNTLTLELGNLPKGAYSLHLQQADQRAVQKLLLQ